MTRRFTAVLIAVACIVLCTIASTPGDDGSQAEKDAQTEEKVPRQEIDTDQARRLYPLVSLSGRMAYLADPNKNRTAPKLSEAALREIEALENNPYRDLSPELLKVYAEHHASLPQANRDEPARRRLGNFQQDRKAEARFLMRWRNDQLRMLHESEVEKFIQREGFGRYRMPDPRRMPATIPPEYFELPETAPIPLANVPLPVNLPANELVAVPHEGLANPLLLPTADDLATFHAQGRFDFVDRTYFGYVKDRDHVAGFRSHSFEAQPRLDAPQQPGKGPQWQIGSLELVSLLAGPQPRVYVAEHLPRMDQLGEAKTRPLTSFEQRGLARLLEGEDLAAQATANHIQMVGSLRATWQCTQCHDAQRGELLGAFTYYLARMPPIEE